MTEVNVAGRTLVSYNLHLENRGDNRLRCSQLSECLDDAIRYNPTVPVILAGDFNLVVFRTAAAHAITQARFYSAFSSQPCRTNPGFAIRPGDEPSIGFSRTALFAPTAPVCTVRSRRRITIRFPYSWRLSDLATMPCEDAYGLPAAKALASWLLEQLFHHQPETPQPSFFINCLTEVLLLRIEWS